jgi:hypothetical protein
MTGFLDNSALGIFGLPPNAARLNPAQRLPVMITKDLHAHGRVGN